MRATLAGRVHRIAPLAKYVAARRALATGVHAFTPARFLSRLGLLAPARWEAPLLAAEPLTPSELAEPQPFIEPALEDTSAPIQPTGEVERRGAPVAPPAVTPPAVAPAVAPATAAQPLRHPGDVRAAVTARSAALAMTPVAPVPVPAADASQPPHSSASSPSAEDAVVPSDPPLPVERLVTELPVEAAADEVVTHERPRPVSPAAVSAPERRVSVPPDTAEAPAAMAVADPVSTGEAPDRASRMVSEPPRVPSPGAPLDTPAAAPAPQQRRRARVQEMPRQTQEASPRPRARQAVREPRDPRKPYGTPASEKPAHREAELGFSAHDGSDRSPLAWAARLADSLRDPSAPAPMRAEPALASHAAVPAAALAPSDAESSAPPTRMDAPARRLAAPVRGREVAAAGRGAGRTFAPSPVPRRAAPDSIWQRHHEASVPTAGETAAPAQVDPYVPAAFEPPASRPAEVADAAAPRQVEVSIPAETRRFLQPLVGIDPAAATFVQGPAARALTSARHADAVAVGRVVALGPQYRGDGSPNELGLLAHEMTHVARRASPRFVPPIARPRPAAEATVSEADAPVDEETTALRVEARVRAAAVAQARPGGVPPAVPSSAAPRRESHEPHQPNEPLEPALLEASLPEVSAAAPLPLPSESKWGGLPAPWEPLPDLAPATPARDVAVAPGAAPVTVAAPASFDGTAQAAALHAAEQDRSPAAAAPPAAEHAGAKPPDLDSLARQVYAVLKRRLQADAARELV